MHRLHQHPTPAQNATVVVTVGPSGTASLSDRIGRATRGYRVVVSVTAAQGTASWSCSTSGTPR